MTKQPAFSSYKRGIRTKAARVHVLEHFQRTVSRLLAALRVLEGEAAFR